LRDHPNKLEQDYPSDRLEIIVISDGSTDGTDDIVREFSSQKVRLIRREQREGKAAGLNEGVRHASGEILVFSDANSLFAPDAIRRMMENFADPEIGYVTGKLAYKIRSDGIAGSGCNAYMKYENALRTLRREPARIIGVMAEWRHPSGTIQGCPAAAHYGFCIAIAGHQHETSSRLRRTGEFLGGREQ